MAKERDPDDVISGYPFSDDDGSDEDGDGSFVCPDCEREFTTKRGLNIHQGQQHDRNGG